jgi:hypothetical protein
MRLMIIVSDWFDKLLRWTGQKCLATLSSRNGKRKLGNGRSLCPRSVDYIVSPWLPFITYLSNST